MKSGYMSDLTFKMYSRNSFSFISLTSLYRSLRKLTKSESIVVFEIRGTNCVSSSLQFQMNSRFNFIPYPLYISLLDS